MTAALAARGPDDEAFVLGDWATGAADCFGGAATDPPRRCRRWRGAGGAALVNRARRPPPRHPRSGPARAPADARPTRAVARLQRRALQRRHDPRRAARRRPRVPQRRRHRGVPRGVGDVGAGRAHAAERDVGVRGLGRAAAPAVVWSRSARHQAALPGPGVVRRARRVDAGRDHRRSRRPSVAARAGDRRVPRHRLDRSRGADVLRRHHRGSAPAAWSRSTTAGVVERRWAPALAAALPARRADAGARFHDALDRAVASHRVSDRPAGALLSGGLDSATIVLSAAAAGRHGRP